MSQVRCLAPPLRSPAPLPPSADHAQSDDAEEERRGLGDLLPPPITAATKGSTSRPLTTWSPFMSASGWYGPLSSTSTNGSTSRPLTSPSRSQIGQIHDRFGSWVKTRVACQHDAGTRRLCDNVVPTDKRILVVMLRDEESVGEIESQSGAEHVNAVRPADETGTGSEIEATKVSQRLPVVDHELAIALA